MAAPETDNSSENAQFAQHWIGEIDAAEREAAAWIKRGRKIVSLYKDSRPEESRKRRRFNILWSNVETIGPAIYARTPQAVVSRRFKDADPVGRQASEVLERAIQYSLEEYDFDARLLLCRQDYLLPGRGQVWVRYDPVIEKSAASDTDPDDPNPEDHEEVTYEAVCCDHVAWDDFATFGQAREWAEVPAVSRRVFLTRAELVKRFGADIGQQVPLDWTPKGRPSANDDAKKAVVYEIWDKTSKQAIWISKGYAVGPLDRRDDPLGLKDFFPCPEPIYSTLGPDSLIPVPDYVYYQDQAEEADELTARIGELIKALRLVGFYAGSEKAEVMQVFAAGNENTLIPIDSWAAFSERGGVKGIIEWVPIDAVIQALEGCTKMRQQVIEDIYQITGISDIMRADSDPAETATATKLKGVWGSLRVRDRQKDLARFARDIIRLKGEIIASKFGADTLKKMTGVQMLTNAERDMARKQYQLMVQQMQQAAQPHAPVPGQPMPQQMGAPHPPQIPGQPPAASSPPQLPPPPANLTDPTWEDVMAVLSNQATRQFRVEIESDSTIDPDDEAEKAAAVEFVETIGQIITNAGPMVQMAPPLGRLVGESIKFLTRRYRVGREMEEIIDQVMDEIGKMPPVPPPGAKPPSTDPNAVNVANMGLQTEQVKTAGALQLEQAKQQTEQVHVQGAAQIEQMKQAGLMQGKEVDQQMQAQKLPLDAAQIQLKAQMAQRDPNPQASG